MIHLLDCSMYIIHTPYTLYKETHRKRLMLCMYYFFIIQNFLYYNMMPMDTINTLQNSMHRFHHHQSQFYTRTRG